METLSEKNETISVKVASDKFFHDPETRIRSTKPIKVLITEAELAESGTKTEISMSGVVETPGVIGCSYTLYFLMKKDVAVIPRIPTHTENVIGKSFVMHFKNSSENLHDSLFSLSLNRVNARGEDYSLGKGRGFLVFDMNQPTKKC